MHVGDNVLQVLERAKNVGAGLLALGLLPQNSTHVGVYSQNRPEVSIIWNFYIFFLFWFVPPDIQIS